MKRKFLWFLLFAALFAWFGKDGHAQPANTARHIIYGGTLPATCNPNSGDVFFKTSATIGTYQCLTANTWTAMGGGGGGATIPSVTNVIKGDGMGNGADTKVAITSPTTAATIAFSADNETVTLPNGTLVPNTITVAGHPLSANVSIACADLTVPCITGNQTITLSGDVTGSGTTAITTALGNIPTAVTMAGYLAATAIAAPATPAAGIGRIYVDSTSKNLSVKDDAGVVKHGVQTDTGAANNYISAIADNGAITKSQPGFSNLSGSATCAQLPALTGDTTTSAGSCATTVVQVNGAVVPTSAKLISTNASKQLVAAAAETAPIVVSATGGISCTTCATTTNGGALSTTSPVTISAAGVIACATCATTTNGGALSATAPVTISAAGVIALNISANLQVSGSNLDTIQGIQTSSTPQFAKVGINQASDATAPIAWTQTSLGTTATNGLYGKNTTAAAAGAQQVSPCLVLEGQGWKTNATAASQAVDWCIYNLPIQGTANPTSQLTFVNAVNGGAYSAINQFISSSGPGSTSIPAFGWSSTIGGAAMGIGSRQSGTTTEMDFYVNGAIYAELHSSNGFGMGNGLGVCWGTAATNPISNGCDVALQRDAAGVVSIYNSGTQGTTAANYRDFKFRSLISGGSVPSISGCSAGTQTGGATSGTYSSGTTGTCTVTITFATTSPTGWFCDAHDLTTQADYVQNQTATSTTTCTVSATTVSGDVIQWTARAY